MRIHAISSDSIATIGSAQIQQQNVRTHPLKIASEDSIARMLQESVDIFATASLGLVGRILQILLLLQIASRRWHVEIAKIRLVAVAPVVLGRAKALAVRTANA